MESSENIRIATHAGTWYSDDSLLLYNKITFKKRLSTSSLKAGYNQQQKK